MSGQEDLQNLVDRLEELTERAQEGDRTLEESLATVSDAATVYRRFRKAYGEARFDVKMLSVDLEGGVTEGPFDWEALDRESHGT